LPRAIDNAHAAAGDFVEQLVIAETAEGRSGECRVSSVELAGGVSGVGDGWLVELEPGVELVQEQPNN